MNELSTGFVIAYVEGGTPLFLIIQQEEGHWGLPKGHPNHGEELLAAARREVAEEKYTTGSNSNSTSNVLQVTKIPP